MSFKKDFIWGVATSSYQIEGAVYSDGKGLSVWDDFCKQPGRIFEDHNGDIACDHYRLYKQDFKLMAELGIKNYRLSISWPRILPNGIGEINQKGLEFYSSLVDELLQNNITPHITLFHWDYPLELYYKGGWLNPASSDWFAEYTEAVVKHLGDRAKHYFTLNEPQCFIDNSFYKTAHAPGVKLSLKDNLKMAHNVLLAHGKAVQVIRANVKDSKVSYAPTGSYSVPETDSLQDIEAARLANFDVSRDNWGFNVAWWSDPVMLGKYPEKGLKEFEDILPEIGNNDFKTICQPLDYYSQNIYNARTVKSDGNGGFVDAKRMPGHPKTAIGWPVVPECHYWIPKFLYERYKTPIIITESGLSCHDWVSLDGKVHDPNRIDYLNRHLLNLRKAAEDGADIAGYFQWSFMDNFEWAVGYNDRFGIVYVDYQTQKRIPKDSAFWYKQVIENNGESL